MTKKKATWGFGEGSERQGWKTFEELVIGGTTYQLAHGEHPHSRQDNTTYARQHDETDPKGYLGFNGIRHPLRIEVKEGNRFRESYFSGDRVEGTCTGEVHAPAGLILLVDGRDASSVLLSIAAKLPGLFERSPALWIEDERKALVGRRVYYRDHPAVITRFMADQLSVILAPVGGPFPQVAHEKDDAEEASDPFGDGTIKDDVYSDRIWWSRDRPVKGEAKVPETRACPGAHRALKGRKRKLAKK